jgi:hypothetical protein
MGHALDVVPRAAMPPQVQPRCAFRAQSEEQGSIDCQLSAFTM